MVGRPINSDKVAAAVGGYSQALESVNCSTRLYVSGQIPVRKDGTVPSTFREQAQITWQNVILQLEAADMSVENLVKVTIFLSDRKFALENRAERQAALGSHAPALTVIITGIFDESWLLEIEAIAER